MEQPTPPLSRIARFRETGEEFYCSLLEKIGAFAQRRWTYIAVLFAFMAVPALLLPTFNSGSMCMISAFFQVITLWVILQVSIAWTSYYALQTVNPWPFWLMLFLHLFSTGVMLDKMKLEGSYCQNILAIRMHEEARGGTKYP
ncbi:MAG: hypothetical protein LW855_07595 [Alphaproteobacteria bacterium]|jgi:hypothetical protein|nr:hypothetical protein [Thalassospira sp.]MCE2965640.1 hypothetical protein [Alphaproteobacteria bacterium]